MHFAAPRSPSCARTQPRSRSVPPPQQERRDHHRAGRPRGCHRHGRPPILYRGNRKRPRLSDLNDCIDHVLRIAGPDHVSIGTDLCDDLTATPESWAPSYGPGGAFPEVTAGLGDWYRFETTMAEGLDTIALMPALIKVVRSRYDPALASKILGLNFMLVFETVTGG